MPPTAKPKLVELSIDAIPVGSPLQFALRATNGALLANRGYTIETREHLERLSQRGVGLAVDIEESSIVHRAYMMRLNKMVAENRDIMDIAHAKMAAEDFEKFQPATVHGGYPDFLSYQMRANLILRTPEPSTFVQRIDEMQRDLRYFSTRFPDATMTALVQLASREMKHYSAMHALLVWGVVTLTARFALKWDEAIIDSLGKAALTMNISMTDMQDRMAQHQAQLKQKLELSAAQEPAWNTFIASLKMGEHPARLGHLERAEVQKMTTPERIERMRAQRAQHHAEADKRADAILAFYAALNPAQQMTFDAQTARYQHHMGSQSGHKKGHSKGHQNW